MAQPDQIVKLNLFGRPAVTFAGDTYDQFGTKRAVQLLARLALSKRRAFTRGEAAELLWPDDHYDATRLRLRQELARLRRGLGPARSILETDEEWVKLVDPSLQVDAGRFRELAAQVTAEASIERRAQLCRDALDLSSETFMEGHSEDWIEAERTQIRDARTMLHICLTECCSSLGDDDEALRVATAGVEADPSGEAAHRNLVRVLSRIGHVSDALGQYQLLKRALREARGEAPSPESEQLAKEIESSPARLVPESLAANSGIRFNVPSPVDPIYGRESVVHRVLTFLDPCGPCRILCLTGPGGIGKTRIAQEVAQRVIAPYNGCVAWVDLADTTNAADVPFDIAAALGVVVGSRQSPLERISFLLPSNPSVLVLDNVEQLLPGVIDHIAFLVSRCSHLKLLVTSRIALGIAGERNIAVGPLPLPTESDTLDQPALRLFLDVLQSEPTLREPSEAEWSTLRQITARLEGIPLSLQLASNRLRTLSSDELLAQLSERLDLVNSRKNAPKRHGSIRQAVSGSFYALSPDLQALMGRFAVFRGGWNRDAAAFVCQVDDPLGGLEALLDASLIRVDRDDNRIRFRMLETIREFVLENLSNEERLKAQTLHADWIISAGERASKGSDYSSFRAFEVIDAERDNLREAASFVLANDLQRAIRLGAVFGRYWYSRALAREGLAFYEELFSHVEDLPVDKELALASCAHSKLLYVSQDYAAKNVGPEVAERTMQLCRETGCPIEEALCWLHLARKPFLQGDYDESLECITKAEKPIRELNDLSQLAQVMETRGMVYHYQGRVHEAIGAMKEAMSLLGDSGSPFHQVQAPMMLSFMYLEVGEVDLAKEHADRALELAESFSFKNFIPMIQESQGKIALEQGDLEQSAEWFKTSAENWNFFGNKYQYGDQIHLLARLNLLKGDAAKGLELIGQAARIWRALGLNPVLPCTLTSAARAYIMLGQPERAARLIGCVKALDFPSRDDGQPSEIAFVDAIMADLDRQLGQDRLQALLGAAPDFESALDETFPAE